MNFFRASRLVSSNLNCLVNVSSVIHPVVLLSCKRNLAFYLRQENDDGYDYDMDEFADIAEMAGAEEYPSWRKVRYKLF